MKHLFPPLLPKEALQPPVLVVAAHPDDEVIGCGAMLAWHRSVGHPVTVVHVSDGAAGDPGARYADIAARRAREGRAALACLGVDDLRPLGFPDGQLPEHLQAIAPRIRELMRAVAPRTVYSFFFTEAHRDHRAVALAVAQAAPAMAADTRCLLFGVNQPVVGGSMFDVTALMAHKERALACYDSQLAYADFKSKTLCRDRGATMNIEDSAVEHVEQFADLRPAELQIARTRADALYEYLLGDRTQP